MYSTLLIADHEHKDSEEFRRFRRSLFHGSLNQILQSLRPYMEKPEVVQIVHMMGSNFGAL